MRKREYRTGRRGKCQRGGGEIGKKSEKMRKAKLFLANGVFLRYNFILKSHIRGSRQLGSDGKEGCLECGSLLFVMHEFFVVFNRNSYFVLVRKLNLHYNIN